MKFLIVTGLSGAGKTTVLHHMEDCGYQCMDNLPPSLLPQVFPLFEHLEGAANVALGVDSRSGALFDAETVLAAVLAARESHDISILFLDADAETLINRYKETRRDHPLMRGGMSLAAAIEKERAMLQPLREQADFVLPTSGLRGSETCERVDALLSAGQHRQMRVEIQSFGYKRGIPRESDLVLDVRFLPNPYYIRDLRAYTGLEAPVRDFVLGKPETKEFLARLLPLIDSLLPLYEKEGKRRLMIAVGCTGGAHRSVAVSEAIYSHLRAANRPVSISHRDMATEEAGWPFRRDHREG